MTKALIIEDEAAIGEALAYRLETEGFEVTWSRDGLDAMQHFRSAGSDLVILDLMLPGMNGEDVCKEIRRTSDVPIIMLTAKDTEIDKVVGLELGADDYITKPFSTRELLARVRAVMRRSRRAASREVDPILEAGEIRLDPHAREVTVRDDPVHLTRLEFDLLETLMSNAGRVMTREALIDEVWGFDYVGDTRTLDVHIKRLRQKCEPDPGPPRHLLTIRGVGYRFDA